MKNELWWVGKTKQSEIRTLVDHYYKRSNHIGSLHIQEWNDGKTNNPKQALELVGNKMINKLNSADYVVLLDERGEAFSSIQFAQYIDRISVSGSRKAIFVIGGAYGFSDALKARANHKIRLSKMTFPHDLVRVIFLEQYYRALSILKNLPYHHQ